MQTTLFECKQVQNKVQASEQCSTFALLSSLNKRSNKTTEQRRLHQL